MKIKKVISLIILIAIAYILPVSVFAKTYNYPDDVRNLLYGPNNQNAVEFLPGDEIVFSTTNQYSSFIIYIDGIKVADECYGTSCPTNIYTVTKKMYFSYEKAWSNKIDFITKEENADIHLYSNSMNGKYYKSGDLMAFKGLDYNTNGINPRIYDKNDNLLYYFDTFSYAFDQYHSYNGYQQGYFLMKLPKIEDKDTYWKVSIFNDGSYGYPSPHFTPIEYTEPKIELKCDKNKLNYGEKTKCKVCLNCSHSINKLNFSINQKDLKLSNVSYLDGVTNSSNNNQNMMLNISDDNICSGQKEIMTFDIEGTKDSTYIDKITLENIEYTDEVVTGKYKDLDSNLNIVSTKPTTNPKTGVKALFIIMPILVLLVVGGLSVIRRKEYEK